MRLAFVINQIHSRWRREMLPDVETESQYHLKIVFGRVGDKSLMNYCWMRLISDDGYFRVTSGLVGIGMLTFLPTDTSHVIVFCVAPAAKTTLITQNLDPLDVEKSKISWTTIETITTTSNIKN